MDFKALFSQLVVFFGKLTQAQKTIICAAVAGIVAFLIFLVVYTSEGSSIGDKNYQVLFDQLSAEDAAKVVEQLEKDKIPYSELKLPGSSLKVSGHEKSLQIGESIVWPKTSAKAVA